MRVVHAVTDVMSVAHFVKGLPAIAPEQPVAEAICKALDSLAATSASDLGHANAAEARAAVIALVDALQNRGLHDSATSAQALARLIHEPAGLLKTVRETIHAAFMGRIKTLRHSVSTFSLILFTADCHDGEIMRSFAIERGAWVAALQPPYGTRDDHLAIVVDPNADRIVRSLAQTLGVLKRLPCVVFMGDAPDALDAPSFMMRCGARTLSEERYPSQFRDIYETAYGESARLKGQPFASAFDRLYTPVTSLMKPWTLIRIIAGAFGGNAGRQAASEIRKTMQ